MGKSVQGLGLFEAMNVLRTLLNEGKQMPTLYFCLDHLIEHN